MHFAVPTGKPAQIKENISISHGGFVIVILFLLTILTSVCLHHYFGLPPAIGMMTGLAYLQFFGYYLKLKNTKEDKPPYNIFENINRIEWDTLLFFYGVIFCVGGLATFGYLQIASETMYSQWGASLSEIHRQTPANVTIGILSAIVDNIPLMYAVLTMHPAMSEGQWLLITLTTGVGGSLLSIGSAAGVALMGQSKGQYTFMSHLKWSWAILLGYFASIATHFLFNKGLF
jgi:Na+/H+ antiporter NhaD/arsenite permease-like protein